MSCGYYLTKESDLKLRNDKLKRVSMFIKHAEKVLKKLERPETAVKKAKKKGDDPEIKEAKKRLEKVKTELKTTQPHDYKKAINFKTEEKF